jgi:hypothetical protein
LTLKKCLGGENTAKINKLVPWTYDILNTIQQEFGSIVDSLNQHIQ